MTSSVRYTWLRDLRDTILGRLILARDNNSGRFVAIKIFKKNMPHRTTENMSEELRIHAMLCARRPSGILEMLDRFDDASHVYAVFEWCGGGDLFEFVANHRAASQFVRIDSILDILAQVSAALKHMHSQHVVHRDLSIENILLTDQGAVRICDFGVAMEFSSDCFIVRDHVPVGKLRFMSPEMFLRIDYDGALNDVWCLGVCVFMLMTGAPPYDVPHHGDARFNMIVSGNLQQLLAHWKLTHLPDDLIDLCQQMLLPESQRISLDEVLQHQFLSTSVC